MHIQRIKGGRHRAVTKQEKAGTMLSIQYTQGLEELQLQWQDAKPVHER
jgi:hypothetical protein